MAPRGASDVEPPAGSSSLELPHAFADELRRLPAPGSRTAENHPWEPRRTPGPSQDPCPSEPAPSTAPPSLPARLRPRTVGRSTGASARAKATGRSDLKPAAGGDGVRRAGEGRPEARTRALRRKHGPSRRTRDKSRARSRSRSEFDPRPLQRARPRRRRGSPTRVARRSRARPFRRARARSTPAHRRAAPRAPSVGVAGSSAAVVAGSACRSTIWSRPARSPPREQVLARPIGRRARRRASPPFRAVTAMPPASTSGRRGRSSSSSRACW